MTKFIVKPGGKVIIGIRGDVESPVDSSKPRYVGVESEQLNYVFRKKTSFSFHDLGSRLRSVPADSIFDEYRMREYLSQELPTANNGADHHNEYVEIRLEAQGSYADTGSPTVELDAAEWARLDKSLLGSAATPDPGEGPPDPVDASGASAANGSGRSLLHSLQIPADMIAQVVPAFFLVADNELVPYEFTFEGDSQPTLGYRAPFPEAQVPSELLGTVFKARDAKPGDANERWNPHNLSSGAAQRQVEIDAGQYKEDKGKHLLIANLDNFSGVPGLAPSETVKIPRYVGAAGSGTLAWHGFFTRDTDRFKITKTPSYSGAAVSYRFRVQDTIYLRPAVVPVRLGVFDGPTFNTHSAWVTRWASVYPGFSFLAGGDAEADQIRASRSLFADLDTAPPGAIVQLIGSDYWLRAGSLLALIKQGTALLYVWTKIDIRRVGSIFS